MNKNILIAGLRIAGTLILLLLLAGAWLWQGGGANFYRGDGSVKLIFPELQASSECAIFQSGTRAVLIGAGGYADGCDIADMLEERGISEITYLFITSPGSEHFGGIYKIAERISIRQIVIPFVTGGSSEWNELLNWINQKDIPLAAPILSRNYSLGNLRFILFPPLNSVYRDPDNHSLAILINHSQVNMFFVGNAKVGRTEELFSYNLPEVSLYKAADHGRANQLTPLLMEQLKPTWTIVTGPIADSALVYAANESGTILYTSEGLISFISDGNTLELYDIILTE